VSSRVLVALRVGATPQRAFQAFVEEIGAWWRPSPLFRFTRRSAGRLAFEPHLGGRFLERQADGEEFEIGRIIAWEPGVQLRFTWRPESFAPDQSTEVQVRFEAVGEETRVTVEHRGWESVPDAHVARHTMPESVFLKLAAELWLEALGRLAGLAQPRAARTRD
jgi:uncharacterized protein YndB with AHSA1/START domain